MTAPSPTDPQIAGPVGRAPRLTGPARVRALALLTAALTVALATTQSDLGSLGGPIILRWWAILPMVCVAELMVVHLRYRREAHSFSLSEIPLILGLFFTPPNELLLAVVLGNLLVLTIHRRQPALKLAFNIAQFGLVTTVAIAVFRFIAGLGDTIGPLGWLGALAAALSGIVVASILINRAIAMMGGRMTQAELLAVMTMSIAGTGVNTALALIAVNLLWWNPASGWLALAPPIVVFLAYKAYVSQSAERARLKAVYEATLDLHNRPRIEDALLCAVGHARSMVEAESAHVLIFHGDRPTMAYRTSMGYEAEPVSMRESKVDLSGFPWSDAVASRSSIRFDSAPPNVMPSMDSMDDGIVVPLVTGDDSCVGLLVAANRLGDISSFDRTDVELLETLASRVSVTLENGQLQHSLDELTVLKRGLEEAAASKDEFIASISHELRTPLTAVVGLSHELTVNGHLFASDEQDEFVRTISQQSLELSYIVDDLLVAARADSGTLQLETELVDLAEVVDSEVQALFVQTDTAIPSVSIPRRGDVFTWADPFRVRQIVRNLLQNAQRYGGADIRVSIERDGAIPAVIVSDDGPGVPPGAEEAIFEAYRRAHGPTAQPASVGLGLAVARQLATLMGGSLTYRRANGRTEFVMALPAPARARYARSAAAVVVGD
ncbi:MAG: ATP-binding protein [Acidimicrobiia bacterium]|nr:ATP-binding protein [Acidimicrobiia bacterium]